MKGCFKHKIITILIGLTIFDPKALIGQNQPNVRLLRYLSFALRDKPPTVAEAKAFYNDESSISELRTQWLTSDDFLNGRLHRFFNDWFGIGAELNVIPFGHYLLQNADQVYHHSVKGSCALSDAVDAEAWWLESGQTAKFCPNIIGTQIYFEQTGVHCSFPGGNGILNEDCGCGALQLLCAPRSLLQMHHQQIKEEFAKRALYIYQNNLTWNDLFVSDQIIGNRFTYHSYLVTGHVVTGGQNPTQAELDALMAIPLSSTVATPNPSAAPERSGVVTAPGFMAQFNNFRSRIRALTERLLCKDIDGSLNTDGISTFLNQSLTDFDRSHGEDPSCSGCHYPMDNLGSTLLGWDPNGFYQAWQKLSQEGWSFGQTGSGPAFMMRGFIERTEGLTACLAKRVWEDFTGGLYADLTATEQSEFEAQAELGPKSLIDAVLNSDLFLAQRQPATETDTSGGSGSAALSFEGDIEPILLRSCAGTSCHSQDTSLGSAYEFIGNPSQFKQTNSLRFNDGTMPPTNSGLTISDAERQALLQYFNQ